MAFSSHIENCACVVSWLSPHSNIGSTSTAKQTPAFIIILTANICIMRDIQCYSHPPMYLPQWQTSRTSAFGKRYQTLCAGTARRSRCRTLPSSALPLSPCTSFEWMDGWMDGWMEWMNEWMEQIDSLTHSFKRRAGWQRKCWEQVQHKPVTSDVILRPSVLGQDHLRTKNWSCTLWSWSWSYRSGVVLWNTVLLCSSS